MTAILKVDTIQDTSGNNIINENANTITIGKSGDTTNIVGTLQNDGSALISGITEADQWRLTANLNITSQTTFTGWERPDNQSNSLDCFSKIGTGMTESSGTFSFPSTGIYLVQINTNLIPVGSADGADLAIYGTKDNSSYNFLTQQGYYSGAGENSSISGNFMFDVTNTSNDKIQFRGARLYGAATHITYSGSTSKNLTYATFIRLGDT